MPYTASHIITIDHTKVGGSNSTNFPFLFSGSYAYLATVANAGDVTSASGYDIIFTSDSAGTVLLNWEIESYDPVTGTVNIWVKVPTVSHTVDTVIYVFYGNSAITTFQGGVTGITQTFIAFAASSGADFSAGSPAIDKGTGMNLAISNGASVGGNGTASFTLSGSANWSTAIATFDGVTPTFVQGATSFHGYTTSADTAYVGVNTVGNTLVVFASNLTSNVPDVMTIADSQGNVWLPIFGILDTFGVWQQAWYAPNCKAGANTVTLSLATNTVETVIAEYSPLGTLVQVPALANGTGTTATTPALTGSVWDANFGAVYHLGTKSVTETFISFAESQVGGGINAVSPAYDGGDGRNLNQSHGVSVGGNGVATFTQASGNWGSIIAAFDGVAATLYQWNNSYHSGTSFTFAYNTDNIVGNSLVAFAVNFDGAEMTATDSQGNTWLSIFDKVGPDGERVQTWYVPVCKAGTNSVIISYAGSNGMEVSITEYTPLGNLTQVAGLLTGTGTAITTPALSPLSTKDSTVNANNGVNTAVTSTTGEIDGGGSFNGTTSVITVPYSASVSPTTTASFSVWVNPTATSPLTVILAKTSPGNDYILGMGHTAPASISFYNSAAWIETAGNVVSAGVWQQVYVTKDGTNDRFYVNGALVGTIADTQALGSGADPLTIGNWDSVYLPGSLDETRISNIARSADWILAEYNNQSSPSTFYTLTAPEPNPVSISPTSDEQGFTGNVTVTGTDFTPSVTENFIAFNFAVGAPITSASPTLDTDPAFFITVSHGVSVGGNGVETFTQATSGGWGTAIATFDGSATTYVRNNNVFLPGGTSAAVALTNTAGNSLIVFVQTLYNTPVMTITDTLGNVWLPVFNFIGAGEGYQAWYVPAALAGANTVTVSFDSSSYASMLYVEYTPLGNLTQVSALATGTGTTATTPALTGPSTLFFSGTGITVNSYSVQTATTITANITITSSATLTARDVIVTNADTQTATLAGAFTVTSGAPFFVSLSQAQAAQCSTFDLTVHGTNFSTATVLFSGAGITINSYSVQNSTTITANITVACQAALTARNLTITNADTQAQTLSAAFTVVQIPGISIITLGTTLSGNVHFLTLGTTL